MEGYRDTWVGQARVWVMGCFLIESNAVKEDLLADHWVNPRKGRQLCSEEAEQGQAEGGGFPSRWQQYQQHWLGHTVTI